MILLYLWTARFCAWLLLATVKLGLLMWKVCAFTALLSWRFLRWTASPLTRKDTPRDH